jgi:hypothetical protein
MPNISSPLPQFEKSERIPLSGIASLQSQPKKRIPTTKTQLSDQHRYTERERIYGNPVFNVPVWAAVDSGSENIIETASLHHPVPRSQEPLPALAIPESTFPWNQLPVLAEKSITTEQDSSTLREAMNTAAKKTGAFVSKAGASIKRVFYAGSFGLMIRAFCARHSTSFPKYGMGFFASRGSDRLGPVLRTFFSLMPSMCDRVKIVPVRKPIGKRW